MEQTLNTDGAAGVRALQYFKKSPVSLQASHLPPGFQQVLLSSQVVLTSMELLKNMAIAGGASSLQSVELQLSLEEMMEMC